MIKPEYVLKPGQEPPRTKRKKNAPDRPQPEWMFPPEEENPVLNPKPKSEEQRKKDEAARDQAIKFLQYKSVSAPLKAPPPDLLLTLVGGFLSSYGFNSTSRIYTTQLQSRKKLDAWKTQLDAKLPKGFPDLVRIYKEWYKVYEERTQMDETSSSDSDDVSDTKEAKRSKKAKKKAKAGTMARKEAAAIANAKDETSSGGSDSSSEGSDSDVEMKDGTPAPKAKVANSKASASSSSGSSSDSDADDEEEPAGARLPTPAATHKPTAEKPAKNSKRKATSSGTSGSSSESESNDASDTATKSTQPKKTKAQDKNNSTKINPAHTPLISNADTSSSGTKTTKETPAAKESTSNSSSEASSSDSSSSEPTSSDSEASEVDFSKPPKPTPTTTTPASSSRTKKNPSNPSSDSSETLQATSGQKPSTANTSLSTSATTSSSDSATNPPTKRKRSPSPSIPASSKQQKKQNTPFQRVPKDTPVDPKLASNAYQSYDYADRAYQDLSVTKGKGFTKEKNKKKRGSYRGGAIDVSGGKGIKFNDD